MPPHTPGASSSSRAVIASSPKQSPQPHSPAMTGVSPSPRKHQQHQGYFSTINWSMLATWVTLFTTVLFNLQFQFIYRNMQQGPLFNTLLTEYSDPLILDALDLLEDFQKASAAQNLAGVGGGGAGAAAADKSLQYAYDFLELQYINHPKGKEIDHARRRLISWYSKVRLFFEFDLLSSSYLGVIPGERRTQFFLQIVEPLDTVSRLIDFRGRNPVFDFFREQYGLPETGRITELDWSRVPLSLQFKNPNPKTKGLGIKADQEVEEDAAAPAGGGDSADMMKSQRPAPARRDDF